MYPPSYFFMECMMKFCRCKSALMFVVVSRLPLLPLAFAQGNDDRGSNTGTNNKLEEITSSSPFEMALYPSVQEFNKTATSEVQNAIKNTLVSSVSVATTFVYVTEIDVHLRNVEFRENHQFGSDVNSPVSLVEFVVLATFVFEDSSENTTIPSRFGLDSLIARAFSLPSSKSSFIIALGQAGDPILNEIEDIEIRLVENPTDPAAVNPNNSLSTIDIVLIVTSLLIFLGILCIIYHYHKNRTGLEELIHSFNSAKESKKKGSSCEDVENDGARCDDSMRFTTEHDEMAGSPCHTDQRGTEEKNYQDPSVSFIPMESNIVETASFNSSVESQSETADPAAESSEMCYASSFEDSIDENSSSSSDDSDEDSTSIASSNMSSKGNQTRTVDTFVSLQPLGSQHADPTVTMHSSASNLTAKLLRLPGTNAYELSNKNSIPKSHTSAPSVLEHDARRSNSFRDSRDEKSLKSARSASSGELESSRQEDVDNLDPFRRSSSTPVEDRTATLETANKFETAQHFHDNWLESKRKALEDIEGNIDDVFQVDVERNTFVDDDSGKISGRSSTVSEFMKSIRVVGAASETQSSAEPSSIGLKSQYGNKENNSTDTSLEQSMSGTLVEIDFPSSYARGARPNTS